MSTHFVPPEEVDALVARGLAFEPVKDSAGGVAAYVPTLAGFKHLRADPAYFETLIGRTVGASGREYSRLHLELGQDPPSRV